MALPQNQINIAEIQEWEEWPSYLAVTNTGQQVIPANVELSHWFTQNRCLLWSAAFCQFCYMLIQWFNLHIFGLHSSLEILRISTSNVVHLKLYSTCGICSMVSKSFIRRLVSTLSQSWWVATSKTNTNNQYAQPECVKQHDAEGICTTVKGYKPWVHPIVSWLFQILKPLVQIH